MKRHILCLLLLIPSVATRGDEEVRSIQEELRRRNIYFGEIDGRHSAELEEALKHYQRRKGLSATGQDDHDTLRSLGVVARGPNEPLPKELQLPDEPVLKSDTKIDVAAEAHEIAAGTGISVASIAPDAVAAGRRSHALSAADHAIPGTGGGAKLSDQATGKSPQSPRDLQEYVIAYLRAVSRNRLEDELHFYGDRVNYLGNGWVDRRIIEHSLRKYYAHWPHRSYSIIGAIDARALPHQGEIVVKFRTAFNLGNGTTKASGLTDNEIVINAATADPRIISITERRVHR